MNNKVKAGVIVAAGIAAGAVIATKVVKKIRNSKQPKTTKKKSTK